MSMRNSIAHIIINDHDHHISAASTADAILAALPDMIAPLVWEKIKGHFYSGHYCIVNFKSGFLVDYDDLAIICDATIEQAQAAANAHHRTAIMAAFTGETK